MQEEVRREGTECVLAVRREVSYGKFRFVLLRNQKKKCEVEKRDASIHRGYVQTNPLVS